MDEEAKCSDKKNNVIEMAEKQDVVKVERQESSFPPGMTEVVSQSSLSIDRDCNIEQPDMINIKAKDSEIKHVDTEVEGKSFPDNAEERVNIFQKENISTSEQNNLKCEKQVLEEMDVSENLEGVLFKAEGSTEKTALLEQDDRNTPDGVEMDCSGGKVTIQNSDARNIEISTRNELDDENLVNLPFKLVEKELHKLKENGASTVTTSTYAKVEIEVVKQPPEEDLGSLSKALVEVETGADRGSVTGMGNLVEYSSSEDEESLDSSASSTSSSSSSSSDSESDDNTSSGTKVEEERVNKGEEKKIDKEDEDESKDEDEDADEIAEEEDSSGPPPVKSKTEVMLQDLPEVPYVDFRLADGEEINLLGKVSSIIGQLVVVASNRDTPALNEDTVLFKENRHPIGVVFEIFGPVSNPFYTVRFNSAKDISDLELTLNADIYFAPRREEITNYVFVKQLRAVKGSDASWINDREPPPECLDYSDDEAEKNAKKKKILENEKRKPVKRRDDPSFQENSGAGGITREQNSMNARSSHHQYSSRGGPSHGPYHGSNQRTRIPFNTRNSHYPGERHHLFSNNDHQQHDDWDWSQPQSHMVAPRVPFDNHNIPPFAVNSNFPQRGPPPPFQNRGLPSGDGHPPWFPQPPQHFTRASHPTAPSAMSPYSVPPPPLMSLGPLNYTSSPFGMGLPPPPWVPPP